jgi:hypothetical protein
LALKEGGEMSLTHVSDRWVCGAFDLEGAYSEKPFHIKGTFAAPLPAKEG